MKTKKEIEDKLREFDEIETFDYERNGRPWSEWIMWSDKGWKKALEWVLGIESEANT